MSRQASRRALEASVLHFYCDVEVLIPLYRDDLTKDGYSYTLQAFMSEEVI